MADPRPITIPNRKPRMYPEKLGSRECTLQQWWFKWCKIPGSRWARVENPCCVGMADSVGTDGVNTAWVEFKWIGYVGAKGGWATMLNLSAEQVDFLTTWPNAWLCAKIVEHVILVPGRRIPRKPQSYAWWRDNSVFVQDVRRNTRTGRIWAVADQELYHTVFGTLPEFYAEKAARCGGLA